MIPRILHFVWVGSPLPDLQREYIATWRETNPDFDIMAWNERNIDMSSPFVLEAYRNKKWAKVADAVRLHAVAEIGGIYLDTDFKLYKSLQPLLNYNCFCAFQESTPSADWVSNGVFGAEPNHWFIRRALDGLYAKKALPFIPERPTTFGPKHITRLLRQVGLDHYSPAGVTIKDIFVTPVPYFFPFAATESFTPACITDQTLGAHFWAKSWENTIPMPIRAAKRVLNLINGFARTEQGNRTSK